MMDERDYQDWLEQTFDPDYDWLEGLEDLRANPIPGLGYQDDSRGFMVTMYREDGVPVLSLHDLTNMRPPTEDEVQEWTGAKVTDFKQVFFQNKPDLRTVFEEYRKETE